MVMAGGVLLAAIILGFGYQFGINQTGRDEKQRHDRELAEEVKSYANVVAAGLPDKKYVLPGVIYLVTLEKSPDGKSIVSDRHMIYQLQALSSISGDRSKNGDAFVEEFHSTYAIDRVPGADPEEEVEPKETNKRWDVLFDVNKGERHPVLTGTHVVMPIPLSAPRKEHMFDRLQSSEDAYCYPNYEGDIIEELVIIVQSGSLRLTLPEEGRNDAVLQHADKSIQNQAASLFTSSVGTHRHFSAVARFRNIQKGEIAGLRIGWEL